MSHLLVVMRVVAVWQIRSRDCISVKNLILLTQ